MRTAWPRAAALLVAAIHCLPAHAGSAVMVFPSGPAVPQNLLRISIAFQEPTDVRVLDRLSLHTAASGQPIELPFLNQELWSRDGRTLTLLLHPGRIKTGLVAHDQFGRALHANARIVLTLDGAPLKTWQVETNDNAPPDPAQWRIDAPAIGSRLPLRVKLDAPIDHNARDLIAVEGPDGGRTEGVAALEASEMLWTFTPARVWRSGGYAVRIRSDLEDASGNRIGSPFEHESVADRSAHEVRIPFSCEAGHG